MEWTTIVNRVHDADITVPDISSDTFAVTIQLKDYAGNNLKVPASVLCYVSSDSDGLDPSDLTSDITTTSDGDGAVIPILTKYAWQLISEADGSIDIDVTDSGSDTLYLVLVMPDGKLVVSDELEFT